MSSKKKAVACPLSVSVLVATLVVLIKKCSGLGTLTTAKSGPPNAVTLKSKPSVVNPLIEVLDHTTKSPILVP